MPHLLEGTSNSRVSGVGVYSGQTQNEVEPLEEGAEFVPTGAPEATAAPGELAQPPATDAAKTRCPPLSTLFSHTSTTPHPSTQHAAAFLSASSTYSLLSHA